MRVQKLYVKIRNDDWYQAGRFLIVKQSIYLEFGLDQVLVDDQNIDEIKQIIDKDKNIESFVAIETKFKLQTSLLSK